MATETDKSTDKPTDDKSGGKDGGKSGDGAKTTEKPDLTDKTTETGKTYTEAELQAKLGELQSETDRKISKAFEKFETDKATALEVERRRAEEDKLKQQGEWQKIAEDRERELEKLQSQAKAAKFREDVQALLAEKGLSEFADILLAPRDTVKSMETQASALKERIDAAIQAGVEERLKTGKTPKGSGDKTDSSVLDVLYPSMATK